MEYQTIAQTMGLSLGNVKTLIHRGKIALAQKMRDREAQAIGKTVRGSAPSGIGHALFVF
jgi:UTP-glucose-1-phosphate uridylyltransferase